MGYSFFLPQVNSSIASKCSTAIQYCLLLFRHSQNDKPGQLFSSDTGYLQCQMSRSTTKPTKWHVRIVKTLISLGIRPVWSESSLSAWRSIRSLVTHNVHREDSDQTGQMQMPRMIWVFAGCAGHFVGFVVLRLICNAEMICMKLGICQECQEG